MTTKPVANVGTVGHVDHGGGKFLCVASMFIRWGGPIWEQKYEVPEKHTKPYYRRFEKKRRK